MTSTLRLPILLESNLQPTLSVSPTWRFDVKDELVEEVEAENITTPFQQQRKQIEYLIKALNIKQASSSSSKNLFLTFTHDIVGCQLLELSLLSNARFIEIYHSEHQSVSDDNLSSLIYLATIKGNPVPLGDSPKKLFTHEFTFPVAAAVALTSPAPPSSSTKPMPFLHLKFLSIKNNSVSVDTVTCEILHCRILIQVKKPLMQPTPPSLPASTDLLSLSAAAISPALITEKLQDLQKLKQDLAQLQQKVQIESKSSSVASSTPLPPTPSQPVLASNPPEHPSQGPISSNSGQLAFVMMQMQKNLFAGMEELLDKKLAPIFQRLDRLEDQLLELHANQPTKQETSNIEDPLLSQTSSSNPTDN